LSIQVINSLKELVLIGVLIEKFIHCHSFGLMKLSI